MNYKSRMIIILILISVGFFWLGMLYGGYRSTKWLINIAFNFFEIELDEEEFYHMVTNYKDHISKCYPYIDERG